MNKSKTDELFDRVYTDVMIANLDQRKREIVEETERYLAPYLTPDEPDADEYGEETENDNDVRLNWDYEETEVWDDE